MTKMEVRRRRRRKKKSRPMKAAAR